MRVADADRSTAFVRRLHVGDKFTDSDGNWELARPPEIGKDTVAVYLLPVPSSETNRARRYEYEIDARVDILR